MFSRSNFSNLWLLVRQLSLVTLLYFGIAHSAVAQIEGPDCDAPFGIVEKLPDGGIWEMCWGYRFNEGINLYNIHYKPKGGRRTKVLADAWVSQIHVRYDNDEASFLDVTTYGLGDNNLANLNSDDCPDGTLINPSIVNPLWVNKNMICKTTRQREYAFTGKGTRQTGWYLDIFSVAIVGQYNYVPTWRFYGDGTIELMMGASGKLQYVDYQASRIARCEDNDPNTACKRPIPLEPFSWPLNDIDYFGISHTHNYFWRLDFDVGGDVENDIVEEIEYAPIQGGTKRRKIVRQLKREAGRSINPARMRSWRIRDGRVANADQNNVAWHIEPTLNGHQYTGADLEPWNRHDFYITKYKACEKFVAGNVVPILNENDDPIGMCPAEVVYPSTAPSAPNNLKTAFVNNENIVNQDIVAYAKVSFHHIPRNEDEPHMHSHWNTLRIVPRSLTTTNPLANAGDITIDVGQRDVNEYGYRYGGNTTYYDELTTRFVDQGQRMMLEVRGFDADTNNEIIVSLNGHRVGVIKQTENSQRSRLLNRITLPNFRQINPSASGDVNVLTFTQDARFTGTQWGVTDIRIVPDN